VNPESWDRHVVKPSHWPCCPFRSSPESIMEQFRERRFTQGLALTVSWGRMWRTSQSIWGDRSTGSIESVLADCAGLISVSRSIEDAWAPLTGDAPGQLGWSAVIASKTLHFLCRALGFESDPPVALDNAVMRQRVWPTFRSAVPVDMRVGDWKGKSLSAYLRYMTAVRVWAAARGWTTTELETTLFGCCSLPSTPTGGRESACGDGAVGPVLLGGITVHPPTAGGIPGRRLYPSC
jgi:hypothetical protein